MTSREKEITGILVAIVLLTVVAYALPLLLHIGLPGYVKPLFWLALSGFIWYRPRMRVAAKLKLLPFVIILVTISAAAMVVSTFAAGFLSKMGRTPYSQSPLGILMNLLQYASVPVMMEWVRNYLLNGMERKRVPLTGAAIVLLFTVAQVNMLRIGSITNLEGFASFAGGELLPQLVLNGYLCYVVYLAGALPAIIFVAITTLPQWFMPVLPDLNWLLNALIGCVVPLMSLMILHDVYSKSVKMEKTAHKKENPYSWIAVLAVSIVLVWFTAGLFPVYPVTIMSGSMEPLVYAGDVVVIERTEASKLKVGDIVQYWAKDFYIIHRVIDIYNEDNKAVYITKGDNNNVRDSLPVAAEQIKGKVIATVPKLGLITFLLRSR